MNIYNTSEIISDDNEFYNSFNNFIFNKNCHVFQKLICRSELYGMCSHISGDIVECGVFKGSGIATWLHLLKMYEPNSNKKVIGFDFFGKEVLNDLEGNDKDMMTQVFDRSTNLVLETNIIYISVRLKESGFGEDKFELVKGNVIDTSKEYVQTRPGFRISILYLDMDIYEPTYHALENFWDRIITGGIIVLDEYAYHGWSEGNAVDDFFKDKKHLVEINYIPYKCPTMYIRKLS